VFLGIPLGRKEGEGRVGFFLFCPLGRMKKKKPSCRTIIPKKKRKTDKPCHGGTWFNGKGEEEKG